MCYESLVNGDASDDTVASLLRGELRAATQNGVMAAVVVVALLLVRGSPPETVAVLALAAFVLGTVLHQGVLLAGAAVLRLRAAWRTETPVERDAA